MPIPTIVADTDPTFRRINTASTPGGCRPTRMTDNFLDMSHFPFVHAGTFGSEGHLVPQIELRRSTTTSTATTTIVERQQARRGRVSGHRRRRCHPPDDHRVQPAVHRAEHHPLRHRARPHPAVLHAGRRCHVAVHVRGLAQRRLFGASGGVIALRHGHRRRGQADARAAATASAVGPDHTVNVQADKCSVEWRRQLAEPIQP